MMISSASSIHDSKASLFAVQAPGVGGVEFLVEFFLFLFAVEGVDRVEAGSHSEADGFIVGGQHGHFVALFSLPVSCLHVVVRVSTSRVLSGFLLIDEFLEASCSAASPAVEDSRFPVNEAPVSAA